jgi:FAD/FMN-containing dehydrogenase
MDIIAKLAAAVGPANLLRDEEAVAPWARDWTGRYLGAPLAVVRPGSTSEVSQVMAATHAAGVAVVPASGRTGLTGATHAPDRIVLSLDRMNRIRAVKAGPRLLIAEAGVILDRLHDAAEAHGLIFPLTFGAKGSAMIGGALSTNAGGSNVLRYGSAREQCLGIEVVLADGRVLDLMSELHKDNSGYALRHLFIGAEGTLGIITAAVLKLLPHPRAYATAMVAVPSITAGLDLLARLREATGGAVEAFEYMPRSYIEAHLAHIPGAREPFDAPHDHTIMVEVGAVAPRDAEPGPDGTIPVVEQVEEVLVDLMDRGQVLDAVVARSEAQRREMWARRESAAEITFNQPFFVDTDIAVPLDRLEEFLATIRRRLASIDPQARDFVVSHLGDGNIHYTAYPTRGDSDHLAAIRALVDDTAVSLGGSFSAEHGIGLSKLSAMRTHKDPVAVEVMRSLKAALDPKGLLNPGKTVPGP